MAASIVYTITAVNSHGYYHPDEHYQIIEFSGYKLGYNSADDLAWEYGRQVRSCIQPTICYILFKLLAVIGITDPYYLALVLRLLTAVFAIFAISIFINTFLHQVQPSYRKAYILLSWFLWFLPFLNIRFSSETWSGLTVLLAVAMTQRNSDSKWQYTIVTGVFLGLSFLFRFQSVIMVTSVLLWLLLIKKEQWGNITILLITILLVIQLGIFIDTWFYGNYTLSFLNYFMVNIVEDVASQFGTAPWHYFVRYVCRSAIFPIGILLLLLLMISAIKQPRHIVCWVIIPFVVMHSIIPHKEGRFIFPIANFVPLICIIALQEVNGSRLQWMKRPKIKYPVFVIAAVLLLINLAAIVIVAFKAPYNGYKEITRYIHYKYGDHPIHLLYEAPEHPYAPFGIKEKFYAERGLSETNIQRMHIATILQQAGNTKKDILLVLRKGDLIKPEISVLINTLHMKKIKQSIPEWTESICRRYYTNFNNNNVLVLYSK